MEIVTVSLLFLLINAQLFCFVLCVYYTTKAVKSPVFMRVYERLSELYFIYFPVRLRLLDTQSFHQPAVLLSSNAERLILAPRPLKLAFFQPFVEQEKTVALPIQRFDSVGSPAAKQEQRVGTRVKMELLFNDSR